MDKRGSTGWLLCIVLGVLSAILMGLIMVWISIERMDTNYFINTLQVDKRSKLAHKAKLEVELEFLLSPNELGRKADVFGLHRPKAGQVRWRNQTE